MGCVLQFGTICPIIKYKSTCGCMLILVKIAAGWSAASLRLTPNDVNFPKSKTRHIVRLFWFFFLKFPENLKISIYTILTEGESISIFILHQFQPVLKSHISLALSSCKEIKTSSDPCKFSADQ